MVPGEIKTGRNEFCSLKADRLVCLFFLVSRLFLHNYPFDYLSPMFRYCCLWVLLILSSRAHCQLPVLHWAKAFTSRNVSNYDAYTNGRTVGVDQWGNVYSAGLLHHTIDFDPGPGVYTLTGGGIGEYGIYLSKLDAEGNFVWAKQIPVLVEFGEIELKVDNSGNVYLASDLRHPADMDPGPGVQMMKPTGSKDAFLIKLDTDGNLMWARQFGGPGDTAPQANALELDGNNNVILCGEFNNTVDFDPGPGLFNLTSTAHMQSYIVKLRSNGEFIWAVQFGHSPIVYNGAQITDVKCDRHGNIYTTGGFKGTCDFDPGTAVFSLTGNSLRDGFVSKLDPNGRLIWAKRFGNTTNNYYHNVYPKGIEIDDKENVVTTGDFSGTHDFDPGTGVYGLSSKAELFDAYILKLNTEGDFLWAKGIGGKENETGNDVVADSEGNVYAVGFYGPSVDFDPGPGEFIINSSYYGASVLVKLNSNGDFVYAAPFQSIDYGISLFRRMVIDAAKNIYITGYVSGELDFDPGPKEYPVRGSSNMAPFVVKLGKCKNVTTSTVLINSCDSYTLNNTRYDSSGVYTQVMPNSTGCDSVISLHLTINKKLDRQTKVICQGESFYAGGANQTASGVYTDTLQTTLGCDSVVITTLIAHPEPQLELGSDRALCAGLSLTLSPGAFAGYQWQDQSTQSTFTLNKAGQYWVKVTDANQCSASDTLTITALLPNPSGFLKRSDSVCAYSTVLLQPTGIYQSYLWSNGATSKTIEVSVAGTYWLQVRDGNGCIGTDTIMVDSKECMKGMFVPTAFSPNGDGKNDVFRVQAFGKVKSFKLQLFNRWGQPVFQTEDVHRGWDGKVGGLPQRSDVFVWICTYQLEGEKQRLEKGTATLIR
jgi:gliding motility-associated-like protein